MVSKFKLASDKTSNEGVAKSNIQIFPRLTCEFSRWSKKQYFVRVFFFFFCWLEFDQHPLPTVKLPVSFQERAALPPCCPTSDLVIFVLPVEPWAPQTKYTTSKTLGKKKKKLLWFIIWGFSSDVSIKMCWTNFETSQPLKILPSFICCLHTVCKPHL